MGAVKTHRPHMSHFGGCLTGKTINKQLGLLIADPFFIIINYN